MLGFVNRGVLRRNDPSAKATNQSRDIIGRDGQHTKTRHRRLRAVHGPRLYISMYGLSITDLDAAACLVADSGLENNSPEPLVLARDPAYRHTTVGIKNFACMVDNFAEGMSNCTDWRIHPSVVVLEHP